MVGKMAGQPDQISAGTQVVSLVEVRGTNNSLVHPRGASFVDGRRGRDENDQFVMHYEFRFSSHRRNH